MRRITGFTVVELIVVTAITLVIVGVLVTGFQDYARYQSYQATVATIAQVLAEVQADATVALQDEHHGFAIDSDRITSYTGDVYDALDPDNDVTLLNDVILTPAFTGGVTSVRLGKVTGLPSVTGTITVVGTRYDATTTITLTEAGVLYYE